MYFALGMVLVLKFLDCDVITIFIQNYFSDEIKLFQDEKMKLSCFR